MEAKHWLPAGLIKNPKERPCLRCCILITWIFQSSAASLISVFLYWEEMNQNKSEYFCSCLISDKYDSGIGLSRRISAGVQLWRSIINVPVFLFACFGATRSSPGGYICNDPGKMRWTAHRFFVFLFFGLLLHHAKLSGSIICVPTTLSRVSVHYWLTKMEGYKVHMNLHLLGQAHH